MEMLGVTLFKGITAYSPWFPRQGNNATFLAETISRSGATCTITIQTRQIDATDAPGDITDMANTITCNATGVANARNTDIKELVRFKYVVTGTNAYDWIHFRPLEPQWEPS